MLMLTLEDAVKVAQRLVRDGMDDEEIIRQELEQKCWLQSETDCKTMQVEMKMEMVQLPCWSGKE